MHSIVTCQWPDDRPELFCASNEELFHMWKVSTASDAGWSGWKPLPLPTGATIIRSIGIHYLTNGLPQIWLDTDAGFFSTWRSSADSAPDWPAWQKAVSPPGF